MDSISLKYQSPNIIMCLLAIDNPNEVMPKKLLNDASEAEIKKAKLALKNVIKGEVQPGDDEAINNLPQTKVLNFTESVQYFASAKTSRSCLEAGLNRFIPLIKKHKEMISQMFDIKISVIMCKWQTLKHKLALANIIFRKTFGLTLKGKHVRTGNPDVFELKLMDCFTYVDDVMTLKLPSGKLIKSYLPPKH